MKKEAETYVIYPQWQQDLLVLGPVTVIESDRRTKSLEVRMKEGRPTVIVRRPKSLLRALAVRDSISFVQSRQDWIRYHVRRLSNQAALQKDMPQEKLSEEELKALKKDAAVYFRERLAYYAPLVGVTYSSLQLRRQKTRWGSCSVKGTISLNYLLMLMPEPVRDYVVVHELCHRKHMDHSARFWKEVERILPDYKKERAALKQLGTLVMARVE